MSSQTLTNDPVLETVPQLQPVAPPRRTKDFKFLPIPRWCQHDPSQDFEFTLALNIFFGSAATTSVMNLYYNQSILVTLSESFNVTYGDISIVPVLTQVGYACGIFFLTPLGDMVRRRGLVLLLVFVSASLSIGLALAPNLAAFEVLSFLVGFIGVTPQVLLPLTADLAPAHRRGAAISITLSGLLLGLLCGRVLAGVISNFSSWRNVYFMAVGLQYTTLLLLWAVLPDYPEKGIGLNYFEMLWSIIKYIPKYPTLIQTCLVQFLSASTFSGWWTTLTFLLTDTYHYNSFYIGLFGLAGITGVCAAPFCGRAIDGYIPWVSQVASLFVQIIFQAIAVGAAKLSVGAVVIVCAGLDLGLQAAQVANSSRIFLLNPAARARLNSLFMLSTFCGQTMGTGVQTRLYNSHGWHASSAFALGMLGLAVIILFSRGPHATEDVWVGWSGGFNLSKQHTEAEIAAREKEKDKAVAGKKNEPILNNAGAVVQPEDSENSVITKEDEAELKSSPV